MPKKIKKLQYVRDSVDLGSKTAAVKKQRPDLSPAGVQSAIVRLEQSDVIKRLREQLNDQVLILNTKRISRLHELLDSDSEKIALGAVAEAGRVVEQYRDRGEGRAKQQVEVNSSHVEIKLDLSGKATAPPRLIEGEEA